MLIFVMVASPAQAMAPARCVIQGAGLPAYSGPCSFFSLRGGGGGFRVLGPPGEPFVEGIRSVTMNITQPDVGEVYGQTRDGVNSRWGTARRSRQDPACWAGADFSVCVY